MSKDNSTINIVKDIDWTSKLVVPVNSSPELLSPIIQLKVHCEDREDPIILELSPEEARSLLQQIEEAEQKEQ